MSSYLFEFVHIKSKEEVFEKVQVRNYELLKRTFLQKKGVLVLTLHLGLWEIIPIYFSSLGYPVNVIVSTVYTEIIDALINDLRKKWGTKPIHRDNTIALIRALRRGECVGVLIDHNFGMRKEKIKFFGKAAYAPKGPLEILYKTGSAPLLMAIFKTSLGKKSKHTIEIKEPVITGNLKNDLQSILNQFEKWIEKYPEQWTWIHDRFGIAKRKK